MKSLLTIVAVVVASLGLTIPAFAETKAPVKHAQVSKKPATKKPVVKAPAKKPAPKAHKPVVKSAPKKTK